jgi:signal transduction histidine kinase
VSVKDVLEKLLEQYGFQIKQKSIKCHLTAENDITVEANKALIEILLGNLLSNAIRYNLFDGYILIEVKGKELVVQNPGKSTSLDTEKVFQRFHKESSDSNSIGLGLAIVKKICTLYNYSLQYQFAGQLHTFSIRF